MESIDKKLHKTEDQIITIPAQFTPEKTGIAERLGMCARVVGSAAIVTAEIVIGLDPTY